MEFKISMGYYMPNYTIFLKSLVSVLALDGLRSNVDASGQTWASHLTPLCLVFFLCRKIGIKVVPRL